MGKNFHRGGIDFGAWCCSANFEKKQSQFRALEFSRVVVFVVCMLGVEKKIIDCST